MSSPRIVIAAGGSGGHIFPAVALARSIREISPGSKIKFIGTNKALDRRIFEKEGADFFLLSDNKLPFRASFAILPFLFKMNVDTLKTLFFLAHFKPDIIVGFGGYASFPAIFSAWLLRTPRLVHEQNVVPGRANKILFSLCDKIALTFERTVSAGYTGKDKRKCIVTGNPLRNEVLQNDRTGGIKKFGLDESKFTLLVIGGSQGAHFLNDTFISAMSLLDIGTRKRLQVIHLTGVKDYETAVRRYSAIEGLESRIYSFIDRIDEAYSASDIVITRAGSSAIFEIACFGKPMILVPYPYALSHQLQNAQAFLSKGAAVVLEEKNLSAECFKDNILKLYKDRSLSAKIGDAARSIACENSSMVLAKEVIGLSEK